MSHHHSHHHRTYQPKGHRGHTLLKVRPRLELLEDRTAPSVLPVGPEFQVNTSTHQDQLESSIAIDDLGNYIIVWHSRGQFISESSIRAQRYDASGIPSGNEFVVNANTDGTGGANPTVAMDPDGNFVVAWVSYRSGSLNTIAARRYDASGNPLGPEFQVNTQRIRDSLGVSPAVAIDNQGNFAVAWAGDHIGGPDEVDYGQDIYAQRYDSSGNPIGTEFLVNTSREHRQQVPSVAMDASGNSVICWETSRAAASVIYAQRYDARGTRIGSEFEVATRAQDPSVAMSPAGDFVIAWAGSGTGVLAQRYDAQGNRLGNEFSAGFNRHPSVAVDRFGNFVITQQSGSSITARQYDASGNPQGSDFLVNTYPIGFPAGPAGGDIGSPVVAMAADGNFVIAWNSRRSEQNSYLSSSDPLLPVGVSGQRYLIAPNPAPTGITLSNPGVREVNADGILVGILGVIDVPHPWQRHTFTLLLDPGLIFSSFRIKGNQLYWSSTDSPVGTHRVRVRVTDEGGGAYQTDFLVTLNTAIGVVDPATMTWYIQNTNSGSPPTTWPFAYGGVGWHPVVGDWDGNLSTTIAAVDPTGLVDPFNLVWHLRNSNTPGPADHQYLFGLRTWQPVAGDWSGKGVSTSAVVDTAGAQSPYALWFLREGNGPEGTLQTSYAFGLPGWIPVAGDWNGDGIDTAGMFDPLTGTWYLRGSNNPFDPSVTVFQFGVHGMRPVVGDWDGDGVDTVGMVDNHGFWYPKYTNSGTQLAIPQWRYGLGGWIPVTGYWGVPNALQAVTELPGELTPTLTQEDLNAVVVAALAHLEDAGAPQELLGQWSSAVYVMAPLEASTLAFADAAAQQVIVDINAAGHGWFVDPTPHEDEEFISGAALPGSRAEGQMDLLTTVLHEDGPPLVDREAGDQHFRFCRGEQVPYHDPRVAVGHTQRFRPRPDQVHQVGGSGPGRSCRLE